MYESIKQNGMDEEFDGAAVGSCLASPRISTLM